MTRITVEESALDAIAAMGKRLQEERDELLEILEGVLKLCRGASGKIILEGWQEDVIRQQIAKCTAEPDILEGKQ